MPDLHFTKLQLVAISTAFTLVIGGGLWWRINATGFQRKQYYQDAARLQREEHFTDEKGKPVPAPAGFRDDKAYQPESGNEK